MKKMKLVWLSMALVGTVVSFAACGDKGGSSDGGDSYAEGIFDDEPEGDDNVSEGGAFGAEVAKDYPISSEMQGKLEALSTDYSKVNWQVAYAPSNNEGVIVSETSYFDDNRNYLVVAFTNLTDEGVKMSYEGYAENIEGDVVQDLLESDVELGPQCTIVRNLEFDNAEPSGEIKWNSFNVEAGTEEYVPWEMTSELGKDASGKYYIQATITADVNMSHVGTNGYGYVLDKDGNIIAGAIESSGDKVEFYGVESFGGENADVAYFVNLFKAHF